MPKLLIVEASPRGKQSISRNLARTFVEKWKASHPGGEVIERDLAKMDLPYVNLPWLGASLTPAEKHSPEMKEVLTLSNELVEELLSADHIAISWAGLQLQLRRMILVFHDAYYTYHRAKSQH